jgi:hypothetical protein
LPVTVRGETSHRHDVKSADVARQFGPDVLRQTFPRRNVAEFHGREQHSNVVRVLDAQNDGIEDVWQKTYPAFDRTRRDLRRRYTLRT